MVFCACAAEAAPRASNSGRQRALISFRFIRFSRKQPLRQALGRTVWEYPPKRCHLQSCPAKHLQRRATPFGPCHGGAHSGTTVPLGTRSSSPKTTKRSADRFAHTALGIRANNT